MTYDHVNRSTYEDARLVELYTAMPLLLPEVMIFVKYKDAYYGKRVLDVGCGAGRTAEYLRHWAGEYQCVDYSERMTKVLKRRFCDVDCRCCDVRDMAQFADGCCDFVLFANNGLDSLGHEDRILGFREINRVLADGGLFVFSTHNRNCDHARQEPHLEFSLDPFAFARAVVRHHRRTRGRRVNRKFEREEKDYAIINDSSHCFSLVTYYIDQRKQVEQLRDVGFETLEIYSLAGNSIGCEDIDHASGWIYYVARKTGSPERE